MGEGFDVVGGAVGGDLEDAAADLRRVAFEEALDVVAVDGRPTIEAEVRTDRSGAAEIAEADAADTWTRGEQAVARRGRQEARQAMPDAAARLAPEVRAAGLVTHSSGNHGRALAWAAARLGVPATVVVPDDAVFVMGDNRGSSRDARYWQHPWVPEEDIVGKAFIRIWPLSVFGGI